jgi:hypothetical protein
MLLILPVLSARGLLPHLRLSLWSESFLSTFYTGPHRLIGTLLLVMFMIRANCTSLLVSAFGTETTQDEAARDETTWIDSVQHGNYCM